MLRLRLCDCNDVYILVNGTLTIIGAGGDDATKQSDERNKGIIFKNCPPFTESKGQINNTQTENVKYIDVVMLMYNLIEYIDTYSTISGSLWQYYRDDPNNNITQSELFTFKIKITGNTLAVGNTNDVKIAVAIKRLK